MPSTDPTHSLVGEAAPIVALREEIRRLASFDTVKSPHVPTVLLEGETGTGKGLVARALHRSGPRARGPFIDVNCAAIPDTMLEAELFGFEAGAFTDAKRSKPGLFEAASGGTLFLDEVDALSVALQSKLLTAIEEKSVRRLGALASKQVDVKLIAATQRSLGALVAEGTFRTDLYHRLAVVVLTLPALRERGDDIVRLAEHFLAEHAAAHGLAMKHLRDDARAWLRAHDWPGNVRELSHLMERLMLLEPADEIDRARLERLSMPLPGAQRETAPSAATARSGHNDAAASGDADEARRIRDALTRAGGNVMGAARLLGIGRNALRYRMRRHGIDRPTLEDLASGRTPQTTVTRTRSPARAHGTETAGADAVRAGGSAPEPRTSTARPPTWEQKPVAVLALETTFPEPGEHDAAWEPWTLATRWSQKIEERIAGFGGVVVQRGAARLSAIFGVPRTLEQIPERAAQAALALRRLVPTGEPERTDTPRPVLRLAVHLGTVRVDTSALDPTARLLPLGDTLALPERLLGHAGPGEILASPQAARRIEASAELRQRELRIGPATADLLHAFAVVGPRRRDHAASDGGAAPESRFVGRAPELAAMRAAFASARSGGGQVVFVVGDPGIGKSRLLAEFRRGLADVPHLWIEGRCASYGATTAFLPIVDGLRRFVGIDDRDDEPAAQARIERAITALGGDLAWTLPFVRQVLSFDAGDATVAALDSASRRSEMFRALKALTIQAAARQPVVLVIEDLHWIDPASEEYLAFLADVIPTTRALLVCSHRPGYRHPFGDRSYHVRVGLRALSAREIADMTGSLLGTAVMPPELQRLIAAKAEGNPFFVEEVTKSLLENGSIRHEQGHIVLARDPADITVPDSIHDVLMARIDRLAEESRRAIQVASVIGREFALRLLERIAEAGDHVRAQVDELRAVELIYEKALHPELAYMFKHALTHDVAYESVVVERRRLLHRMIGRAIEDLYADRLAEHYETLAHHFGRAGDFEPALLYHERAAEKAAASYANHAVVEHCRQALAMAERLGGTVTDARRGALETRLGMALFYLSEYAASGEALERAAACAGDPEVRALASGQAALSYVWAHAYEPARRAIDTTFALAREHRLPAAEAMGLSVWGFYAAVCESDIAGAERQMNAALALHEQHRNEGVDANARFNLAQLAEWTGDYGRTLALTEQVMEAGRRLRLPHLVVFSTWFRGKAFCCLGDYGRAIAQLEESYRICDSIGDRAWKTRLLNTLGWCFAEIADDAQARLYNERAAVLAREIGDPELIANSEINLAGNRLALGDLERALAHLEPIRAALARPGDPWMRWRYTLHALHAQARVEEARGAPERALALADEEHAGASRYRVPKVAARALVLRGRLLTTLERRTEAAAALSDALRIADDIRHPHAAWEALGLLATLERRSGRTGEADAYAARRRAVVARAAESLPEALRRRFVAATGGA